LKLMTGPWWFPSLVWLNTTSRITSMPARCSAFTMSRNSRMCSAISGETQYALCGAKNPTVLYPQ
jgi:hypothetical protein